MKLCNPGALIAAPVLEGRAAEIAAAVERLPGVVSHTHWLLDDPQTVDGAEYHLGDEAIGHIHLDGSVHLPMDRLAAPLVDAGLATYTPWSRSWVMLSHQPDTLTSDAVWLFELACNRVSNVNHAELLVQVRHRASWRLGPRSTEAAYLHKLRGG